VNLQRDTILRWCEVQTKTIYQTPAPDMKYMSSHDEISLYLTAQLADDSRRSDAVEGRVEARSLEPLSKVAYMTYKQKTFVRLKCDRSSGFEV
jgi:hypothetical protein